LVHTELNVTDEWNHLKEELKGFWNKFFEINLLNFN
jgi:hypothetical protein